MISSDKVSIIVRTCERPDVLKTSLDSLKKQTYKNIEIIVVEDGAPASEEMIKKEYYDLPITYYATIEKKGRSVVGNIGLKMASGTYLNFLDDDDVFYANHVELLVECLKEKKTRVAYSIAEESQIKILSQTPYRIKEKRIIVRYKQTFNKLLLFAFNYIPIQSIMFERSLFEELGGFDEQLDYLEDWDLWVRFASKCEFAYLPIITSKYFVPYRSKRRKERTLELEKALKPVYERFSKYQTIMNINTINKDMDYILNVYNKKGIVYYLKMIRNYLLYGEL